MSCSFAHRTFQHDLNLYGSHYLKYVNFFHNLLDRLNRSLPFRVSSATTRFLDLTLDLTHIHVVIVQTASVPLPSEISEGAERG